MSDATAPELIEKQPSEVITVEMSFTNVLGTSETVSSADSVTVSPTGPTLGTPAVNSGSTGATVSVSGGTDGVQYRLEFTVTTSASNTLIGDGLLLVKGT